MVLRKAPSGQDHKARPTVVAGRFLKDVALLSTSSSGHPAAAAYNAASSICLTPASRPAPRRRHRALLTGVPRGLARLRPLTGPPPAATTVRMVSCRA